MIDRNELLKEKTQDKESQNKTPLVLIYNCFLPNISNIVWKHWSMFNISRTLQGLFQEGPITAFKRKSNLKKLIGSNCIENGKVKQAKNTFTTGKCSPCLSKTGNLCCIQLISTATFHLSVNKQTKKLESNIKLTAKVSTLFTWWNARYVINNTYITQRLRLTLDWIIIEKIPKTQTQL